MTPRRKERTKRKNNMEGISLETELESNDTEASEPTCLTCKNVTTLTTHE
jgi:hypothetical protein